MLELVGPNTQVALLQPYSDYRCVKVWVGVRPETRVPGCRCVSGELNALQVEALLVNSGHTFVRFDRPSVCLGDAGVAELIHL